MQLQFKAVGGTLFAVGCATLHAAHAEVPRNAVLFENVRVFDGKSDRLTAPSNVLIVGNTIKAISAAPMAAPAGMTATRENLRHGATQIKVHGMLRVLARGRLLEARGFPMTDDARRTREDLAGKLAAQGVDVDGMLARRDAVIAARRQSAEAGVATLDGREVRLAGFLLRVAGIDPRANEYVLVSAPGACSHAMPPPPNQVVRIRLAQPPGLAGDYLPATVAGTLRSRSESGSVQVVDGERVLASTCTIDDGVVVPRDR